MSFDVNTIRADFPFFKSSNLAYLDNSATSLRPKCVTDAVTDYNLYHNANPYRGLYDLSIDATDRYEEARKKVATFINASMPDEVIFTRNTSESMNLIAYSLGDMVLSEGDEIITTVMEHHSNMLPWRLAAKRHGAVVKYLHTDLSGELDMDEYASLLNEKTKIVAVTGMSNVFGRTTDVKTMATMAHKVGAYFVADGAQRVPHMPTDVQELDVDFLAFSGHKMLAPMGIGVMYGKKKLLEAMPPFLTGGEMIEYVTLDEITYAELPNKFEAGTVNVGGAVGLAAAIDYINKLGFENIVKAEEELTSYALEGIRNIPNVIVLGGETAKEHNGIITFKIEGVHPHDVSAIIADAGVAVRAGHHCAEPLHHEIGIPSTTRASLMFYNTKEEVDRFLDIVAKIRPMMGF
ncbi:MAG: SufS family cysteine desulfurase [Lachnospiraceae bacterium]|nr:SufS family cysteine desulfurase [Lachnospiraceae bacterium]